MNYAILKTIIETSLREYLCQNCHHKLDENALNITKISDGTIDFLVICPHCQSEAHMHAEVGTAQLNPQDAINSKKQIKNELNNINAIKESDIALFEKNITETNSIEDLLK
jgi:uncharacterized CHY-type Zn-finger protein